MRLLAFALALPVVPFLPTACFSSSSGPPGPDAAVADVTIDTEVPDAPALEASPPAEAAPPDAPVEATIEASVDAPVDAPVEAGPAPVTVLVESSTGPEVGVAVVFSDAQGNLLASAVTDASGTVSHLVASGSQATVLLGSPGGTENLVTFIAVEPGDALKVLDPSPFSGSVTLAALPPSPPPNTLSYLGWVGSCETYGTFTNAPDSISLGASCTSFTGTFPFLLLANDTNGPAGFTFQNGNTLPADGGAASVSPPGPWLSLGTQQITGNNPPAPGWYTAGYTEVASGVPLSTTTAQDLPPDSGASATFPTHPGYADFVQSEISTRYGSGCSSYIRAIATRSATATGSAVFDLSQLPPYVGASATDGSIAGRPTLSWGPWVPDGGTASLASASGTFVQTQWSATPVDGGAAQTGTWTFVVPPTASTLTAPALSGALAAWAPAANAQYDNYFSGSPLVVTVQGDVLGTYGALRQVAGPLGPAIMGLFTGSNVIVPPLPVAGTLIVTAYMLSGC